MKSSRFNLLCTAWLLPVLVLEFSANAQSFVLSNTAAKAIPRRASIILVIAEGLGYGDLSCYGQTNFQTPNLDKLAAAGMRFTNYFAGAAADSPAQAALVLGRDSGQLRQRADADIPLASGEITVAQMLKNSGYHTGLLGEWNLGDENSSGAPWKKGFDEFAGYFDATDAANFYADYMWRLNPDYTYDETYNDPINGHWKTWNRADGPPTPGREMIYANTQGKNQFIPDLLTKAAMSFVRINQPDAANRYQPFFLMLEYKIPGDGRSQVPTDAPFSEESWPQPAKNKAAMIARLDSYIGQLTEQLQQLGMTNNTAIFFTSATTPKKNDALPPGFFGSAAFTNDLRVPMIVCWPGTIPPNAVSNSKCSARDFLPTVADIGFVKLPENIDGTTILPALRGQSKK